MGRVLKTETLGSNPDTVWLMLLYESLYSAVLEFSQTIDVEIVRRIKEVGERENWFEVLLLFTEKLNRHIISTSYSLPCK